MKLCYLYSDITMNGGIERVLSIIASELADNWGYDVTIVSIYRTQDTPPYKFSDKIKIVYLSDSPYSGSPGSFHRLKLQIKTLNLIKAYFKRNRFDIIAAQSFPCAFMAYLSGIDRSRIVAVEHVYYGYYNKLMRMLRNRIYGKFKWVVSLTQNDTASFKKCLQNVSTIPNPVVFGCNSPSTLDSNKIISVGRLEYQKGFDILLDVFKEVNRLYPLWTLHIYGEGTLREALSDQIKELGLESCVFLEGVTKSIDEKYRESAFCVVSSRFEGFPMTITEAMREGVPCVSFRCPNGPEDLISDGKDGILVSHLDKAGLTDAISTLIIDKSKRKEMGKAAFYSIRRFDVRHVAEMWNDLYVDLVNTTSV